MIPPWPTNLHSTNTEVLPLIPSFQKSHLIPHQAAGEVSEGLSNSAEICNSHKAVCSHVPKKQETAEERLSQSSVQKKVLSLLRVSGFFFILWFPECFEESTDWTTQQGLPEVTQIFLERINLSWQKYMLVKAFSKSGSVSDFCFQQGWCWTRNQSKAQKGNGYGYPGQNNSQFFEKLGYNQEKKSSVLTNRFFKSNRVENRIYFYTLPKEQTAMG